MLQNTSSPNLVAQNINNHFLSLEVSAGQEFRSGSANQAWLRVSPEVEVSRPLGLAESLPRQHQETRMASGIDF